MIGTADDRDVVFDRREVVSGEILAPQTASASASVDCARS
jgi:hypothetical protein